jgi:hypothetical protein
MYETTGQMLDPGAADARARAVAWYLGHLDADVRGYFIDGMLF